MGVVIGEGSPGPLNAITDVAGVRVGHTTLISGDGPLVVGKGPIRTGVTVIVPHEGDTWAEPVFAGTATMNGNGELTGLEWVREAGLLSGPIGITNTNAVGTVRDALVSSAAGSFDPASVHWSLPVAGETYDGRLNDIAGGHVRAEHVAAALAGASGGPVAEGNVGGGTGMICHEFKGGIGTASRRLAASDGGWTVGVLVQANHGRRGLLRIDGVPVGEDIPLTEVQSPWTEKRRGLADRGPGSGSIIGIIATDAPLLPHQCARLARRAPLGVARVGGLGSTTSGDIFLCFATGNRGMPPTEAEADGGGVLSLRGLADRALDPLIEATVEATEEAIVNALVAAATMTGRDGITAERLPHDRLVEVMRAHGRHRG
ncbi:MAG: P1 family peptidase [Candidatus Limnocylindrales bacterium]